MAFLGFFKPRPVKAYWWNKVPNFGDALAPLLLQQFSDIEKVEWDTISRSTIVSVGSILEHIPPDWDGYILGSGKLFESGRLHDFRNTAKILALRGPLSARGFKGNFTLGDPGILANELVEPQEKKWDLGIVPHWRDKELADRFISLIPAKSTYKVIKISDDPLQVIREIGSSRRIVTSSLHGAILADAFGGIPRRIEICDEMLKEGGAFKFRDYSESINTPFEAGKMMEPSRFHIDDLKFNIYDAYRELASLGRE